MFKSCMMYITVDREIFSGIGSTWITNYMRSNLFGGDFISYCMLIDVATGRITTT